MKREFSGYIEDKDELSEARIIKVVVIRSGDFAEEGIIPREEILRCFEKMKNTKLPIFYGHQRSSSEHLGDVTEVFLDGEKIVASVELYENTDLQRRVIGHIKRGNINNVSLGFKCNTLPFYENRELLTDLDPQELSIVEFPFGTAVCDECKIIEKSFSKEESEFVEMDDSELLIEHLMVEMDSDEKKHDNIVKEMQKRGFYHG